MTSCTTTKPTETTIHNSKEDAIYFVVLRISKDSTQGNSIIELLNTTKSIGKLKKDIRNEIDSENYLTVDVYEQEQLINTFNIVHPLYKNVEYLNEENTFTRKLIELNAAEFFIRLQMNDDSSTIKISETLGNSIQEKLLTIKL